MLKDSITLTGPKKTEAEAQALGIIKENLLPIWCPNGIMVGVWTFNPQKRYAARTLIGRDQFQTKSSKDGSTSVETNDPK